VLDGDVDTPEVEVEVPEIEVDVPDGAAPDDGVDLPDVDVVAPGPDVDLPAAGAEAHVATGLVGSVGPATPSAAEPEPVLTAAAAAPGRGLEKGRLLTDGSSTRSEAPASSLT
jgi:hypothetical protein